MLLNKRRPIDQMVGQIVGDPGNNGQRLCEVGMGYSRTHGETVVEEEEKGEK